MFFVIFVSVASKKLIGVYLYVPPLQVGVILQ